MPEPNEKTGDVASVACTCNADPFVALPPEMRPRAKPPMGNLRHVICPMCGLEYWTNRAGDVCPDCERRTVLQGG
jgi:hypothetical protein